jgi:hypothetical protein
MLMPFSTNISGIIGIIASSCGPMCVVTVYVRKIEWLTRHRMQCARFSASLVCRCSSDWCWLAYNFVLIFFRVYLMCIYLLGKLLSIAWEKLDQNILKCGLVSKFLLRWKWWCNQILVRCSIEELQIFPLAPCCFNHRELLVRSFGLAIARPGYTKRKVEW